MRMTGERLTRQKILSTAAVLPFVTVCGMAAGFTAGVLCFALISVNGPATRDYIFFWATGQQLAHHANPYDEAAMTRIEHSAGMPVTNKMGLMRNPPWALPLVYPLGFLSPRAGWLLWSMFMLACLAVSVRLLWILYGRPRNSRYLIGLSFGPALLCLLYGQTSLLLLLGLTLFLRLYRTQPFLAGSALALCALKPHLFLPFGAALLAWVLVSRSYKLVAGAAAALAASSAIAFLIDPRAWAQYAQMARTSGIEKEYIPCLSYLLRSWLGANSMSLQFLPAVLGCAWALSYYWPRRQGWDWAKNGSPLLLVSLLVAPYSWIYDQGVVIPALLQGAFLTRSRNLLVALAFLSAMVEVALYGSIAQPLVLLYWTLWTAPAWLVWYLIACNWGTWGSDWPVFRAMRRFRAADTVKEPSGKQDCL